MILMIIMFILARIQIYYDNKKENIININDNDIKNSLKEENDKISSIEEKGNDNSQQNLNIIGNENVNDNDRENLELEIERHFVSKSHHKKEKEIIQNLEMN